MSKLHNEANLSYIIQVSNHAGLHYGYMRIDQSVGTPVYAHNVRRISKGVENHLNHLGKKTGMAYQIIFEGHPQLATAILGSANDCPF